MTYIPLDRDFAPLANDKPADIHLGRWGRAYGGLMDWDEILTRSRVVLLAEASSGKTEELRHRATVLRQAGAAAFFVRIEDLADGPLSDALDPGQEDLLDVWRPGGNADGWFFLDSVDEARLNGKKLERALKRLSRDLGPALARAKVVISCRVSDWRGKQDRRTVLELLPPPQVLVERVEGVVDGDAALLDPIFGEKTPVRKRSVPRRVEPDPDGLLVVQLVPLSEMQQSNLASGAGVDNVEAFLQEIERLGLGTLAERPGDLLELARYWRDTGRFGSLAQMTEHAVTQKLVELDPFRPDSGDLDLDEARKGAERLAGALTFGRSFTLLATGDEADPTLAAGALDPQRLLADWTPAKRAALVRRGVFTPSTYGRLRFHHRSTQEYLTATWLNRLLAQGMAKSKLWDLLFVERYGIETLAPSLRPVAAWLALTHADIRDEIVRREPVVLIAHGDPKSLSLDCRRALLQAWAQHDATGAVTLKGLDDRALWLFADPGLAPAIRAVWPSARTQLRLDMLTCIREAKIVACADLALEAAMEASPRDAYRLYGADALVACEDAAGLDRLAASVRAAPEALSARVAAAFAEALFPGRLNVEALLQLIARSRPERVHAVEGFGRSMVQLMSQATPDQRLALLHGLGAAALAPPLDPDHRPLQPRYREIAKALAPFGLEALTALGDAQPSPGLLEALRAVERSDRTGDDDLDRALFAAVRGRPSLNRALFWANVEAEQAGVRTVASLWQLSFTGGRPLWGGFGEGDLEWLAADVRGRPLISDRKLALESVIIILRSLARFESDAVWLDDLVAGDADLVAELAQYRAPRPEPTADRRYRLQAKKNEAQLATQRAADQDSWRHFREVLAADPGQLDDPAKVASWRAGAFRLWDLSNWLSARQDNDIARSAAAWRDLGPVFGWPVAEAYRRGMMAVWRAAKPERPVYQSANHLTTKRISELVVAGLNLEAAESDWITKLSDAEVALATRHAICCEQTYPEWLNHLLATRRAVVLPLLKAGLAAEWRHPWGRSELLWEFYRHAETLDAELRDVALRLWRRGEPAAVEKLKRVVGLICVAPISPRATLALSRVALQRFEAHRVAGADDLARLNLAVVIALDPERGVDLFADWVAGLAGSPKRIESAFSDLFGRDSSILTGAIWGRLSLARVVQLVILAYQHVPISGDADGSAGRVMASRDYAQQARDAALSALLARRGPEVFAALNHLAETPGFERSATRMRELAHERAEEDAEADPWTENDTVTFDATGRAPVRSGADLLRVVEGVLADIQLGFTKTADSSSRKLLIRAADEAEVQEWLAEQLNLRAAHRFNAARETEVADRNRPDVTINSTSADVQVAIEVKHGGMPGWSPRRLRRALRRQLAEQYLFPANRRHGVFLITRHSAKTWRDPDTGATWSVADLIAWLQREATDLRRNSVGEIAVRVVGLDPIGPTTV